MTLWFFIYVTLLIEPPPRDAKQVDGAEPVVCWALKREAFQWELRQFPTDGRAPAFGALICKAATSQERSCGGKRTGFRWVSSSGLHRHVHLPPPPQSCSCETGPLPSRCHLVISVTFALSFTRLCPCEVKISMSVAGRIPRGGTFLDYTNKKGPPQIQQYM